MSPYRLFNQGRLRSDSIRYRNLLSGNIGISSSRIVLGTSSSPFLHAWAWSNVTGFGAKTTNPISSVSGEVTDIQQTSSVAFVSNYNSPYINAYSWFGGFGSKYSDPATLPGFYATSITYNSASPAVAVSDYSSPYVDAYPWSNSTGFGT